MNLMSYALMGALVFFWSSEAEAVDSYRYLHVTIDTPWMIFIFLFFLVFAPMILAAILTLRNALRRDRDDEDGGEEGRGGPSIRHD